MADPILRALRLRARRRVAALGWGGVATRAVGALVALTVVQVLLEPVFLDFLGGPADEVERRLYGLSIQAGLVVFVASLLLASNRVLRSGSRPVLTLLPVDPAAAVHAELRVGVDRAWLGVAAVAYLLLPVLTRGPDQAFLDLAFVLAGAMFAGLNLGAVAFLGAIVVARSQRWAPLLDLARGNNPRPQAAIIWAVGPATLIGAFAIERAAVGGRWWPLPLWGLAIASGLATRPLARRAWFPATAVLSEIRARYDQVDGQEEAQAVWLDWTVRWLPETVARWARLDMRFGWRAARGWVSASWLVAAGAFAAGWTDAADGPVRAGIVGGLAVWCVGVVPLLQVADEAPFLRQWLPRSPGARAGARAFVVAIWGLTPVVVAGGVALLRAGTSGALTALALGTSVGGAAVVASAAWAPRGRAGLSGYGVSGALVGALVAWAAMGGMA